VKVTIYATADHQTECGRAMIDGLARHGIAADMRRPMEYAPSDLAVVWGHRQHRIMQGQQGAGRRYLVMERGYFRDRFAYFSLGYDGLNGRADFLNAGMPGDRWKLHGVALAPWRDPGEGSIALVCGQVPGDAALKHVNYRRWQEGAVIDAKRYGLPVVFRPHPHRLARGDGTHLRVKLSTRPLAEDLHRAAVVVTLNSNTGVDAAIAGVPVVTSDVGAMARAVSAHRIGEISRPPREQWAADLAYAQWTLDEIRSGEAWAHIGRGAMLAPRAVA